MKLVRVAALERDRLAVLLDDYLQEVAGHRDRPVGATRAADCRYFDAYFRDEPGRHAFFIEADAERVGFVLIRGPESTHQGFQVAESYVAPAFRRRGLGHAAMTEVFARFPGAWELQVHARNEPGRRFWADLVERHASAPPQVTEIDADDGRRLQLRFRISAGDARRMLD